MRRCFLLWKSCVHAAFLDVEKLWHSLVLHLAPWFAVEDLLFFPGVFRRIKHSLVHRRSKSFFPIPASFSSLSTAPIMSTTRLKRLLIINGVV